MRLCDGILGTRDLVYFPPWIPVLPAGFSQVLASIRLGSWKERRGSRGLVQRDKEGGATGGEEEGRAAALESVTHKSAQLGRWKDGRRTGRDR